MPRLLPVDPVRAGCSWNRRQMLRGSGWLAAAAGLADLLRRRAQAGGTARRTAVIFVTLGGGPSQFETYDPKPEAPAECRGIFQPIATAVPGVQFCELLPRQAQLLDRLAVVRTISHSQASHIAEHIVETGYDLVNPGKSRTGEMPSQGAVVSKVRGPAAGGIPAYVSLPRHHAYAGAHWLGGQHHHFAVNDDPSLPDFKVSNLALLAALDPARLGARRDLSRDLDRLRHLAEQAQQRDSLDAFSQQAFDLLTSDRAQAAFEIGREPAAVRDRYGRQALGQRLLLARRLVEAGVPFVTVRMGDWDDHQDLAAKIRPRAQMYDQGLSALVTDLAQRGLDRDVLVVAMGEFGRTPRINPQAGRDHWPAVNSVVLAGGGYRMGQVIGTTDAIGGAVRTAPYKPQHVLCMIYRHLGIDPALTFPDYAGRPRAVLEERGWISELL